MITLDGNSLTLKTFEEIVLSRQQVKLTDPARAKLKHVRGYVDKALQSNERVYSINTGFGALSKVSIPAKDLVQLQINLIRSHCTGVGEPHTEDEARAILLLRTNVLAKGFSGVREEVVDCMVAMLNAGVHPWIPTNGSVGASGDLAPLAHLAAVAIGEGKAYYKGQLLSGGECLKKNGIKPIALAPKEGLALINGTQQMTAMGLLLCVRAKELVELSDLVAATSLEGVLGSPRAYLGWVQDARPHKGQSLSASRLRNFMEGSQIYESHIDCDRVQDPYSFRCAPQVHGACRDLLTFAENTFVTEMNSATDNPLVHPDSGDIVSSGNFHGQPVAFALDILGMAISEISSISERRTAKLIEPAFSGLPTFLVKNSGLNSGFMIPHVTAVSLVAENKLLTHPASTDSIPTNNEKEDHVSMGPLAARKAKTILENTEFVLAIEALAACQAMEFRRPLKGGKGPEHLFKKVREVVPKVDEDRYFHEDFDKVVGLIRKREILKGLEL